MCLDFLPATVGGGLVVVVVVVEWPRSSAVHISVHWLPPATRQRRLPTQPQLPPPPWLCVQDEAGRKVVLGEGGFGVVYKVR